MGLEVVLFALTVVSRIEGIILENESNIASIVMSTACSYRVRIGEVRPSCSQMSPPFEFVTETVVGTAHSSEEVSFGLGVKSIGSTLGRVLFGLRGIMGTIGVLQLFRRILGGDGKSKIPRESVDLVL
jgi:hypothetical protein